MNEPRLAPTTKFSTRTKDWTPYSDAVLASAALVEPVKALAANPGYTIIPFAGHVGVEFMVVGSDADGEAFTWRLYLVEYLRGTGRDILRLDDDDNGIVYPMLVDTFATTISGGAGVTDGRYGATALFADTIVSGGGTAFKTYLQDKTARDIEIYSPAGADLPARVMVPDAGNAYGFAIGLDLTSGSTVASAQVLYALKT